MTLQVLQGHEETFWRLVKEHPDLVPFQIANKFYVVAGVAISNDIAKQFVSKYRTKH